ncbi:MAG: amidohydrolase family protein [Sedimentisphaerales bacterium]|nr:amidohydrolase family protein [Sedimentisphaerales bacterium]
MLRLRAGVIALVTTPAIIEGGIIIENGRILAVGLWNDIVSQPYAGPTLELPDSILLPGFVNAHTHMELSIFKDAVPYNGSFADWLGRLRALRRNWEGDMGDVLAKACRESLAAGVTTVGDISWRHRAWRHLKSSPLRKIAFAEIFGLENDPSEKRDMLQTWIDETLSDDLLQPGVSPHAPYTVGRPLFEAVAQLARQHQLPLMTHLSETREEFEFLHFGRGPIFDDLRDIHFIPDDFTPPGCDPVDYFLSLNLGEQPFLLAHVNYITTAQINELAKTQHSVVYCPRSHQFFRHPPHPFRDMLAAGINVCLGTDSLASNSTLSILDEIRFLHQEYPDIPPDTLLQMATINGARALNLDHLTGSLEPGKAADLIALPLNSSPHVWPQEILESISQPTHVFIKGEKV